MDFDLAATLAKEGFRDARVLAAMMRVDRQRFVPEALRGEAAADEALPIGRGQTISQPLVVATMTSALGVGPGSRVLDVGTGSGYQAAILAELGCEVFSVERIPELAEGAAKALAGSGIRVHLRVGDGALGWPDEAPFDGIVVAAAAPAVPPPLLRQLAPGGTLVMPLGGPLGQRLTAFTRRGDALDRRELMAVMFVPLVTPTLGSG